MAAAELQQEIIAPQQIPQQKPVFSLSQRRRKLPESSDFGRT
jgi:hypothetical protein